MKSRSRRWIIIAGILLLIIILNYEILSRYSWSHWNMPLSGRVIVLDAGHGAPDGGADYGNLYEKDIALKITKYLKDYLQEQGALVLMTREGDSDLADPDQKGYSARKAVDLQRRATFINNSDGDLFVSVHLNASPSETWHGAQTFYDPKSESNEEFASFLQDSFRTQLGNTNRSASATSSIYLLKASKIPSALVEVGFITNPDERNLMKTAAYQKKIAGAIYNGIMRYYTNEKTPPK
ncbi:N-acetylmuramoyl-L-alanine amidase CwlD [Pullulanibacillus sp. KACC 23026]|uniref:N-acetylmuramoyl-L-alanine amidase CwlD n=1 Tax=Pullulanibacillus sp. KACC 23026 TaxID=3028315 RepID=UPI0023B08ACA|nr:N-acetylmuramoyl-L-alanine amidase CwlD [Pullulanibacillus sp. KACC 23026]WEG12626.1 N-acetylmuramoyl-L-alanine amidase CwlD [Pullulanibacillus sp. KACC 23026]